MKNSAIAKFFTLFGLVFFSLFAGFVPVARATLITWTNTQMSTWSVPANWQPNRVPGPNDTAEIPLAGTNGVLVDGNLTVQNLILDGGFLETASFSSDSLTVTSTINWTNGFIGCIVTNLGVMTLAGSNGVDYVVGYPLYNAGTFHLLRGNLQINFCADNGALFNLAGAVLDFQNDVSIDISSDQFGLCPPNFSNAGTIRKSGGAGTSFIFPPLNNSDSGIVDAQTGTISLNGGGTVDGILQSEGAGALVLATNIYNNNQISLTLNGNLTSTNAYLNGANLVGSGSISGVLTWLNGALAQGDGGLTVASNGMLVLAGTNGVDYALDSFLTNYGTIKLVSGNLLINFCNGFGRLLNLPGGVVNLTADTAIDSPCDGLLLNQGSVLKSGGAGTSDIGAFVDNTAGVLSAQAGVLALTTNYNLTGGTFNLGINGPGNSGQISLDGNPVLSGTLVVNLNQDYLPAKGASFTLVTYGSETGEFTNLDLPAWVSWQTNYGATAFTLTVQNNQPKINAPTGFSPSGFGFKFAGNPNATYSILATTNITQPLTEWSNLGPATLISNDLFQYVDTHATNFPARFYLLTSP